MPTIKTNEIFANRYKLIKQLGIGGYSEVWLAEDQYAGNMEVAVKIYAPGMGLDEDGLKTFVKEYTSVFNLNNAHLLKPMHYDVCEGSPYLVLQYCKNGSLYKKIGTFTENQIVYFIIQASEAIAYLHKKEPPIIHQDIKPDNFLIDEDGNYLLADFGISSKIRRTLTRSMGEKASTGTMAYMPPEKFNEDRQAIKAGDIFSLGVCVYELLTGELAFGDLGGLALKSGADLPKLPNSFSKELNSIIRSCLAKDPWDRPTAETLKEIAENYKLSGKWDLDKLPIAKEQVAEKQPEITKEPEKQPINETVQIPVNEKKIVAELPIPKKKSRKNLIISVLLIIIISSVIGYFYLKKVKDYYIEEATTVDSTMVVEEATDLAIDTTILHNGETNTVTEKNINNVNPTETNGWQVNYDKVYAFFFGRAVVMKNGKYGYVDTYGKLVIPLQYQDAFDFRKEGLALVKKNKLFGFIDKYGNVVINFYFEKANSFENGKAYVYSEGDGWYYIDTDGNNLKPSQKKSITQQNNGESKSNIQTLKIGDTYAGGIIFFLDYSGKHGRVCAPYDQSTGSTWNEAISICNNLSLDGYDDWYLPNLNELKLMYNNLHVEKIEVFSNYSYWSSTEFEGVLSACTYNFNSGLKFNYFKGSKYFARAIRSF